MRPLTFAELTQVFSMAGKKLDAEDLQYVEMVARMLASEGDPLRYVSSLILWLAPLCHERVVVAADFFVTANGFFFDPMGSISEIAKRAGAEPDLPLQDVADAIGKCMNAGIPDPWRFN